MPARKPTLPVFSCCFRTDFRVRKIKTSGRQREDKKECQREKRKSHSKNRPSSSKSGAPADGGTENTRFDLLVRGDAEVSEPTGGFHIEGSSHDIDRRTDAALRRRPVSRRPKTLSDRVLMAFARGGPFYMRIRCKLQVTLLTVPSLPGLDFQSTESGAARSLIQVAFLCLFVSQSHSEGEVNTRKTH